MFLFTYILCVKCNVLYAWGPNVQARGGPQTPSANPVQDIYQSLSIDKSRGGEFFS